MFGVRGASEQAAGQELERPLAQPQAEGGGPGDRSPGDGPGGGRGPGQHHRGRIILVAAVAVAVVIAGTLYAVLRNAGSTYTGPDLTLPNAAVLRLVSVAPAANSTHVNGAAPVLVEFNGPLKSGSPSPVITPAVRGTWTHSGDSAIFTPATALAPSTRYTIQIPAGIQARGGARLSGATTTVHFTTGGYSPLRLSQLLSQLGYLPMTWAPATSPAARAELQNVSNMSQSQEAMAFDPPAGTFALHAGYPAALAAMWTPDQPNVVLKGAIMAFQHNHGMLPTGVLSAKIWADLFAAAAAGDRNASGYTYAVASKSLPESLTIWHNGHQVFHTLANTGIPVAPTVDGTFPVYQKFRFQIMSGTNPNGSHYSDPVSFVSYFNGGDAVHYFPRPGYGYQQSLGCVELPYNAAATAYPFLTYGSLVTVSG
ncbi:MAG TPA: Ig-like domain-containing protein [Streptosporangiaceae bacterium]